MALGGFALGITTKVQSTPKPSGWNGSFTQGATHFKLMARDHVTIAMRSTTVQKVWRSE